VPIGKRYGVDTAGENLLIALLTVRSRLPSTTRSGSSVSALLIVTHANYDCLDEFSVGNPAQRPGIADGQSAPADRGDSVDVILGLRGIRFIVVASSVILIGLKIRTREFAGK